jgi:hypothetical protein
MAKRKSTKEKQRSTKHTHKTKDRVTHRVKLFNALVWSFDFDLRDMSNEVWVSAVDWLFLFVSCFLIVFSLCSDWLIGRKWRLLIVQISWPLINRWATRTPPNTGCEEEFEDNQRGNQNSYIDEEQITQWPKEKVQRSWTKTQIYNLVRFYDTHHQARS